MKHSLQYEEYAKALIVSKSHIEKEEFIFQVRSYDAQALVGNAGGCIGLFLGWTLLNIPGMIGTYLSHTCLKCKTKTSRNSSSGHTTRISLFMELTKATSK